MSNSQFCTNCCREDGYTAALRQLQAIADAIPVHRYTASQIPSCNGGCCNSGCCHHCCGGCQGCPGCCDPCVQAQYYGYPAQDVAAGGDLIFSRYSPPEDGEAGSRVLLPPGRFLIAYSASVSGSGEAAVGLTPQINGVAFPRGASSVTVPAGGSATLSTSFVVALQNPSNALVLRNSGDAATYRLLNLSITRLC